MNSLRRHPLETLAEQSRAEQNVEVPTQTADNQVGHDEKKKGSRLLSSDWLLTLIDYHAHKTRQTPDQSIEKKKSKINANAKGTLENPCPTILVSFLLREVYPCVLEPSGKVFCAIHSKQENAMSVKRKKIKVKGKKGRTVWELLLLLVLVLGLALEGSLDHVDERAESAEESAEAKAPALDADGVDEEVDLRRRVLVAC